MQDDPHDGGAAQGNEDRHAQRQKEEERPEHRYQQHRSGRRGSVPRRVKVFIGGPEKVEYLIHSQ